MNRISRNRISRTSHPRIHPEPLEPRQLLAATPVFYTTGAVTLGSPGQVAFTHTQDLAPGTTYSYDLNNDGAFEVQDSTSPACDFPATDLASVGPHTISARINDPLGTHSDYQIQIPVNPAPEYLPLLGLDMNYIGSDDGQRAMWTRTWSTATLDGSPAVRMHEVEYGWNRYGYGYGSKSCRGDEYYTVVNGLFAETQEQYYFLSSGDHTKIDIPQGWPLTDLTRSKGWSQTWTDLPVQLTGGLSGRGAGQITTRLSVLGVQSVHLASGLNFDRALVTQRETWLSASFTRGSDPTRTFKIHEVETLWFVQGLGEVKRTSTGTVSSRWDLASLPDWAKYLSLSSDGILHVNGTTSDDTITFAVKGKTLTCYRNGVPDSLPLASVRGIIITGQGGNDSIDASKLSIPVTITTGSGNDSILGSKAADSISSGDGNDTILSGKGNDTLLAGNGNSYIDGGAGDDIITAGSGANTIHGGAGNDLIAAGTGSSDQPNILYGDAGNDTLTGGSGNDSLYGGAGNDTLAGQLGGDLLAGNAGTNRYEAVDGVMDILDARGGRNDTGLWDTAAVQDTILGKITPA